MKCVVNGNDMSVLLSAVIGNCHGITLRIHDCGGKIMIYLQNEEIEYVVDMTGSMPIFIEPMKPYTEELNEFILRMKDNIYVISDDKNYLSDLFISCPELNIGYIEQPRKRMLDLDDSVFFIKMIILHYNDGLLDRIKQLRESWPEVVIFINNVCKVEQVTRCMMWEVDGVMFEQQRIEMVQHTLTTIKFPKVEKLVD